MAYVKVFPKYATLSRRKHYQQADGDGPGEDGNIHLSVLTSSQSLVQQGT